MAESEQAGVGNSGAPAAGSVSAEDRAASTASPEERSAGATLLKEEIAPPDEGVLAYVASDEHANSRFLVKAGVPTQAAPVAGSTLGIPPLVNRVGDVWAIFTAGILVTDDPLVIKWCEENPTKCRRSDDPMTKSWATLKALSTDKANRERLVPTDEIDADAAFPPHAIDHALAAQAAKEGSAGSEQVRNAEISRQSAIDTAARK